MGLLYQSYQLRSALSEIVSLVYWRANLCVGLNAMPFRTEARKCNHWATGGLLELGRKFNATYLHIKCSFYWQANLALGNMLWKNDRPCISYGVFLSPLFNLFKEKKKRWRPKKKEKKLDSLCGGLNAMPFRTEARKCNPWATGGLLELGSKFNATYMHKKCSFYWQANLAFGKMP